MTEETKPGLTSEETIAIINAIKKSGQQNLQSPVKKDVIEKLLNGVEQVFKNECTLIEVAAPVCICGDIHGQIFDLLRLFHEYGWPPARRYLFLGDYVDRGPQNTDTIVIMLAFKFLHPNDFFLLRGNHETKPVNATYGFKTELEERFTSDGKEIWKTFNRVFDMMPLAARVNEKILCMHGGISPNLTSLDCIRKIARPIGKFPDKGLEVDLLWADPDPTVKGFSAGARGVSFSFGPDAVIEKCDELGVDMIARAHQVMHNGFEYFANNRLITLFTAPDYSGQFDNHGAVLYVDENMVCKVKVLSSRIRPLLKEHPPSPPSSQAPPTPPTPPPK